MRNEILNSIAIFSLTVEKVSMSLLQSLSIDLQSLSIIVSLVRAKQIASKNFNTMELGWSICGENDLVIEELQLFYDFFSNHQKFLLTNMLSNKEHPVFHTQYLLFQMGINDREGLVSYFRTLYKEHKENRHSYPFKNILVQIRNHELIQEKFSSSV